MPDIKTVVHKNASFASLLESVDHHQAKRLNDLNQRDLVKSVIILSNRDVIVNKPMGGTIRVRCSRHEAPRARRAFIALLAVAVIVGVVALHAGMFGVAALGGLAFGIGSAWPRRDGGHSRLTHALFGASMVFGLREALDVERHGGGNHATRTAQ
jgi:hypothetical protein